jgi:hypothetical protein
MAEIKTAQGHERRWRSARFPTLVFCNPESNPASPVRGAVSLPSTAGTVGVTFPGVVGEPIWLTALRPDTLLCLSGFLYRDIFHDLGYYLGANSATFGHGSAMPRPPFRWPLGRITPKPLIRPGDGRAARIGRCTSGGWRLYTQVKSTAGSQGDTIAVE